MKTVKGDLIDLATEGKFDVIAHGANCFRTMGRGIAAQIKSHFPEAYDADCRTAFADRVKLGSCTAATVRWSEEIRFDVVNAYTQYDYRGSNPLDYKALRSCMRWLGDTYAGRRIGMPKIGAGLAGGDWTRIEKIIEEELGDEDVTIVEWAS